MKASHMDFEIDYDDASGVQYAVRYTASRTEDEGDGVVEIECGCAGVRLPTEMLGWLRECLRRIDREENWNE